MKPKKLDHNKLSANLGSRIRGRVAANAFAKYAAATSRRDHALVGVFVSMLLTIALAGIGAFLLLEGDSTGRRQIVPEVLRVPGLVLMLFSGMVSAGVVVAGRGQAVRRGFTRAAQGALWTGAVVAALNVAVVALLAYATWRRHS